LTARRTFRCKGDSPEPILKTAQSYARRTHARWRDYPADRLYRWCDDTVIRAAPADSCIRSLGVDDWAWRKGQNYGTIFVDLLPDRMNLSAAIERALEERSGELCLASGGAAAGGSRKSTRSEESGQRWPNNENKCDAIQRYQRAIRTDLGIQRKTIRRRWLRAGQFPERKPPTGGPNSRVGDAAKWFQLRFTVAGLDSIQNSESRSQKEDSGAAAPTTFLTSGSWILASEFACLHFSVQS